MIFVQLSIIGLLISLSSSAEYTSIFADKDAMPLILGNFQNKLNTISNSNDLEAKQINANLLASNNIQSQINQVTNTNKATKDANDAANAKLSTIILTFSSLTAAVGSVFTANRMPAVGAAYQRMATAVGVI